MKRQYIVPILIIAFVACPARFAVALGPYYVTDFGSPSDGDIVSWARDVNSLGQVVGATSNGRAFLWQPDSPNAATGQIHALQDLEDGGVSLAFALNDLGQVVGRSSIESDERGFLWHPDTPNGTSGSAYDLGSLNGGGNRSSASGINGVGQVVGYSQASTGVRAFLWQPSAENSTTGELVDLGDLPGGEDYSVAHDINDDGQVVGSSWAEADRVPFLWNPDAPNASSGTLENLGDLEGGRAEGGAIGINNNGQVVGDSSTASGFRAFLTDASVPVLELSDLGDLPGGSDYSLARDINSHGQIVGVGTDDGLRAVTWTDSNQLLDLNELLDPVSGTGWTLNYASGVNDAGQIVGYGVFDGSTRGFLLTPVKVPTPNAISLSAIQATLVFASLRRRRL